MTAATVEHLDVWGPGACRAMTPGEAARWCAQLARRRYENFSVLSGLVPRELRPDFAAVYAFCRWADDLGDEIGDPGRALELLAWWREELRQCFAGQPRHPVFVALRPAIERHDLPMQPFDDLIAAFEQDQTVRRYQTWEQLLDYCRGSANPVGRLVLMLCGEPRDERVFQRSDAICTALQLTNHLQDIRRDILERDRIYLPRTLITAEDFERRLIASAKLGHGVDHGFLQESRQVIRECVRRTWALYEQGEPLLGCLAPATRPLVWLFAAGGQHVLRLIEMWNYETALHRPRLSRAVKLRLVAQAHLKAWLGGFTGGAAA